VSRVRRFTGECGVGTALLFGAGNALWGFDMPSPHASGGEIVEFYAGASDRIVVGGALSLLAAGLFMFFIAGLREVLRDAEGNDLFATVALCGALLGAGAGLVAEAVNLAAAYRAGDGELTESTAHALWQVSYVMGWNAAGVGLGVLTVAVSVVALRTRSLLPRWIALAGIVVGIAWVTPLARAAFVPGSLLLAASSVGLLRRSGEERAVAVDRGRPAEVNVEDG
jgi:hypothetical protein